MTDLENRFWLCEQVLEVRQQGGMSVERALAMLHKLTDLETHEPYLSDEPPVPGVMWDHGEPLIEARVQDLREAWAKNRLEDELEGFEPVYESDAERHCPICGKVLERKRSESHASFAARKTDSRSCAATLREQRRREQAQDDEGLERERTQDQVQAVREARARENLLRAPL